MQKVSLFLTAIFCAVVLFSCKPVEPKVELKSIEIRPSSNVSLFEGETRLLTVMATDPSGHTLGKINWTSSNPDVVTVDAGGIIEAVSVGTATITATTDGVSATCNVTVLSYYEWVVEHGIHSILYIVDEQSPLAIVENEYGLLDSLIVWEWYLCGRGVEYSSGQGFIGSGPLFQIPCLIKKSWRMVDGVPRGYFIVLGEYTPVNGPFTATTESMSFERGWMDIDKFNLWAFYDADIPESEFFDGAWLWYINPNTGGWQWDAFIQGNNFHIDWSSGDDDATLAVMNWSLSLVPLIWPTQAQFEAGILCTLGAPVNLQKTYHEDWRPAPAGAAQKAIRIDSNDYKKIKEQRAKAIEFAPKVKGSLVR